MQIPSPYLLFLGDAKDQLALKTAQGIVDWRPGICLGQLSLPSCNGTVNLPELSLSIAKDKGAKTLIIGVVNPGGVIPDHWLETLKTAISMGYNLAAGMHTRLKDIPELAALSHHHKTMIFDVRHPHTKVPTGTGEKRTGNRILTVGTDCAVGKKYTALVMEREMKQSGMKATFRATGQTGILISGQGMSIDAVPSDFISGTAEWLSPENEPDHWDVIEGQGSLFHPSFAGVSLGLLHGAQPDWIIICHEPTRTTMRNVKTPMPTIEDVIKMNLTLGKLTNPAIKPLGLAINTAAMNEANARTYLKQLSKTHNLPATDPMRFGVKEFIAPLT